MAWASRPSSSASNVAFQYCSRPSSLWTGGRARFVRTRFAAVAQAHLRQSTTFLAQIRGLAPSESGLTLCVSAQIGETSVATHPRPTPLGGRRAPTLRFSPSRSRADTILMPPLVSAAPFLSVCATSRARTRRRLAGPHPKPCSRRRLPLEPVGFGSLAPCRRRCAWQGGLLASHAVHGCRPLCLARQGTSPEPLEPPATAGTWHPPAKASGPLGVRPGHFGRPERLPLSRSSLSPAPVSPASPRTTQASNIFGGQALAAAQGQPAGRRFSAGARCRAVHRGFCSAFGAAARGSGWWVSRRLRCARRTAGTCATPRRLARAQTGCRAGDSGHRSGCAPRAGGASQDVKVVQLHAKNFSAGILQRHLKREIRAPATSPQVDSHGPPARLGADHCDHIKPGKCFLGRHLEGPRPTLRPLPRVRWPKTSDLATEPRVLNTHGPQAT